MKELPITKNFRWNEFKRYRNQSGMQKMSEHVTIGDSMISTSTVMGNIEINKEARLEYSWNIYNGSLYERLDFKGGMRLNLVTPFIQTPHKKKSFFVEKWAELKGIEFYGSLKAPKGIESLMTLDAIARKTNHLINKVVLEANKSHDLDIGQGFMIYKNSGNVTLYLDGDFLLDFYVLEGGDYFISYEKKGQNHEFGRELSEKIHEAMKTLKFTSE